MTPVISHTRSNSMTPDRNHWSRTTHFLHEVSSPGPELSQKVRAAPASPNTVKMLQDGNCEQFEPFA
jgi:hypothetical protein